MQSSAVLPSAVIAALSSASWTPTCKFYKKGTQSCKFGSACKFMHASGTALGGVERAEGEGDFMGSFDEGDRRQDRDETVKLCPAWINTGTCPRQGACKLRHGTLGATIGKAKAAWVAERRQRRAALPSTPGDDIPYQDKVSRP